MRFLLKREKYTEEVITNLKERKTEKNKES